MIFKYVFQHALNDFTSFVQVNRYVFSLPDQSVVPDPVKQRSPAFLAPGTGGGGRGDGLGMIQVHCIYCALYFYYYYIVIYNEIILQLTIMQNQWEP